MRKSVATITLLLASAVATAADCNKPSKPSLPDGATATKEQMLAGQKAVKAFQSDLFNYRGCLEAIIEKSRAAAKGAAEGDFEKAQTIYNQATNAYNEAVSMEQDIAGQFNTEIREYKAALAK